MDFPAEMKNVVMFGPEGSFGADMPTASHASNGPALRREIVDINAVWPGEVHDVLAKVRVPVHYRQAEVDRLWVVDEGEVRAFAAALTASPRVDAAMVPHTGHCMDFHRIAAALQVQQLGFALQCAAEDNLLGAPLEIYCKHQHPAAVDQQNYGRRGWPSVGAP